MRLDRDGLGAASGEGLTSERREVVGRPPLKHLNRPLMVQVLGHAIQHSQGLLKPNCRIEDHTYKDSLMHARWHGAGPGAAVPKIKMCTRSSRDIRHIQPNSAPLKEKSVQAL